MRVVGMAVPAALVVAGSAACGAPARPEPPPPAPTTLTFTVAGTGVDSAQVRYFTARISGSRPDATLPWTQTIFDPASSLVRLHASAPVPPGGTARLRCSIEINSEIVAESASRDEPGDIVECSAGLAAAQVP